MTTEPTTEYAHNVPEEGAEPEHTGDRVEPEEHHDSSAGIRPVILPPIQRVPPTSQSRREFSIKGLPLDHAAQGEEDEETGKRKSQANEEETFDVPAVGAPDVGAAAPSDGLPPPLQYQGYGRGLINDIRRRARYYRTGMHLGFTCCVPCAQLDDKRSQSRA